MHLNDPVRDRRPVLLHDKKRELYYDVTTQFVYQSIHQIPSDKFEISDGEITETILLDKKENKFYDVDDPTVEITFLKAKELVSSPTLKNKRLLSYIKQPTDLDMKVMYPEKPVLIHDKKRNLYYNKKTDIVYQSIEGISRKEFQIVECDISNTILFDVDNSKYYDVDDLATEISKKQAEKLTNIGDMKLRKYQQKPTEKDLKEMFLKGAVAAGGTATVAAGAASVPFLAGFTSAGIAGGSIAAAVQSGIGSVAAGSGFAALQSIAATTLIGTALPVAVAGAAAVGTTVGGVALYKHMKKKKEREQKVREGMMEFTADDELDLEVKHEGILDVDDKRVILFEGSSQYKTKFYDTHTDEFVTGEYARRLADNGLADIKIGAIPRIILLDPATDVFYHVIRDTLLSENEAQTLVDNGECELKIKLTTATPEPLLDQTVTTGTGDIPECNVESETEESFHDTSCDLGDNDNNTAVTPHTANDAYTEYNHTSQQQQRPALVETLLPLAAGAAVGIATVAAIGFGILRNNKKKK